MRKERLYAPGPVELPPAVLEALARPVLHHRTALYAEVQDRVAARLRDVFLTGSEEVITISGSGSAGLEAAFLAAVPAGAKVLVINAGKFGERWLEIARTYRHETVELAFEWGRAADPAELEAALARHPDVKAVLATHSETSTGVLHDVEELARVTRERAPEALFIVDAVTSLGSAELRPLDWGLDAVVAGSQKGLLAPPGLAFIWLSERARQVPEEQLHPHYYLNLRSRAGGRQPTTPAVNLVVALDVALGLILDEGLENVWRRRARLTADLISSLEPLGFTVFAERVTPAVAALRVPPGVDGTELVAGLRERGLTVAGGQDRLAGKIVRPSLLGWADEFDVAVLAAAFRSVLAEFS
ncbi:MAG TPA: alanine--glyoxylate aminotransferase family protein [Deinococcales bacterium]|nr:alanine--glyoxylate aminotransferase family protein [Deinococcales bacterium]